MISEIKIGAIVISKSGRDKGKPFVVTQIGGEYVYLCDGKLRPYSRTKKKKIIHLQRTGSAAEEIASKIEKNENLLDADFRKALKMFIMKGDEAECQKKT